MSIHPARRHVVDGPGWGCGRFRYQMGGRAVCLVMRRGILSVRRAGRQAGRCERGGMIGDAEYAVEVGEMDRGCRVGLEVRKMFG